MRLLLSSLVSALLICGAVSAAAPQPIAIAISTRDTVAKVGSPVTIKVELTNLSQKTIDTSENMDRQTGLDPNFDIKIVGPAGDLVVRKTNKHPELAAGQAFPNRQVNPGETVKENFELTRAYDFASPGKYVIQISRAIPKELGGGMAQSNKITVTVTP